ncbi:MAG: winged helix-turn-helix transcriptional regulator [Phycisphaerales bacterium]|nr:winged helix-turn-helix transcriptional regulator [Phycisphaerales bacterium]
MAAKAIASAQALDSMCLIFKLLSDATRLEIVLRLTEKEHTVTALCKELKLPQPTVSHHLGLLRMNHLIVNKRAGKQVIYSLASHAKISKKGLRLSVPPFTIAIEQD